MNRESKRDTKDPEVLNVQLKVIYKVKQKYKKQKEMTFK